jgi:hypothetical protein
MNNDELTPDEYESLRRARVEAAPPRELEEDTVAALRERGLVRPPIRLRSLASPAWIWATAAALVALVGWTMLYRQPPQDLASSTVLERSAATAAPAVTGPRYMLLLYAGRTPIAGAPDTRRREYADWARGVASRGIAISGEELSDEAHEVGAASAQPTDPLPRGFFVVSAPDLESAQRIVSTCPHLRYGGRIVVKKIVS